MISSNGSHLALLAVLLFAAHLPGNLAADGASEDVIDDTMNDTTTDLSSLLDVELAVEDKAKMLQKTSEEKSEAQLENELVASSSEDDRFFKKVFSSVKKHVVDPVKQHVVDPFKQHVVDPVKRHVVDPLKQVATKVCVPHPECAYNHFVNVFNRLFKEKMPNDECSAKNPGNPGFEQDVVMQKGRRRLPAFHNAVANHRLPRIPTHSPTRIRTHSPTRILTRKPTRSPTRIPTRSPTRSPTPSPTRKPTHSPTRNPTTRSPTQSCVCMSNDQVKKSAHSRTSLFSHSGGGLHKELQRFFCCTRKTSTTEFIWQFTLWSIKSCTVNFAAAGKCILYAAHYIRNITKVVVCFAKKTHQALSSGSNSDKISWVFNDVKDGLRYLFGNTEHTCCGSESEMNMLDGGHTALTLGREDLNTYEKRLYHVTKAFLQANAASVTNTAATTDTDIESDLDAGNNGVAHEDMELDDALAGMNTDESEKMDEERNTSGKSSKVQDWNELRSVLVEMEHSQKSMGRSEWAKFDAGDEDWADEEVRKVDNWGCE